jgi:heme oxygenase (biliverdin-IX-beta and delta-forming)
VDRYGFELAATTPEGPRPARLEFDTAVATADDVRQVLIAMVKRARAALH